MFFRLGPTSASPGVSSSTLPPAVSLPSSPQQHAQLLLDYPLPAPLTVAEGDRISQQARQSIHQVSSRPPACFEPHTHGTSFICVTQAAPLSRALVPIIASFFRYPAADTAHPIFRRAIRTLHLTIPGMIGIPAVCLEIMPLNTRLRLLEAMVDHIRRDNKYQEFLLSTFSQDCVFDSPNHIKAEWQLQIIEALVTMDEPEFIFEGALYHVNLIVQTMGPLSMADLDIYPSVITHGLFR